MKKKSAGASTGPASKKTTKKARPKNAPKTASKAGAKSGPAAHAADLSQFGGIVSKSLELAGASINLGINLVQKFGTSFEGQLLNKIADAGKNIFAAKDMFAHASAAASPQSASTGAHGNASQGAQQQFAGIVNRLPLFPGSTVSVPFSINNDAPNATRKVKVSLDAFKGELTGAVLSADTFSITPAHKQIAPLDFEKFVITGSVPINCKSDAYDGTIIVDGDESMRIPLKITIMGRG
jgi:hypothetical protein